MEQIEINRYNLIIVIETCCKEVKVVFETLQTGKIGKVGWPENKGS